MHVRPATPSDFDAVTNLLSEADIPHDDLTPSDMEAVLVCQVSDDAWFDRMSVLRTVAILPKHRLPDRSRAICGVVGLKIQGRIGLIHALALSPEMQKEGDRTRLLNELERRAEERGLKRLYLLAEADQGFFHAQGYQIVSHREIPEDLRSSGEGTRLRPSDAVPMRKQIGTSVRTVAAA